MSMCSILLLYLCFCFMEENTKNVFIGILVVLFVAFLVGLFVWGMTRLSLNKQINHLSQEKSKYETLAKDKEQEKETAVQKTIEQYKALLNTFKKDNESVKIGCQTYSSIEDIKKNIDSNTSEKVFTDKRISDQLSAVSSATWCQFIESSVSSDSLSAFVMNGNFGKENNIVGFVTKSGEVIIDKQYNQPTGDVGLCGISGFMDGNLMYQCAGGDGPGGFSSWYILRKDTQKSVLLKACTYQAGTEDGKVEQTKCEKNTLNLAQ